MKIYFLLILFAYILKETFKYMVIYLNLNYMMRSGLSIPPEFEGRMDANMLNKAKEYQAERIRLGIISSLFNNIVIILLIFGGLLNLYNSWIASLDLPFILSGWLFFMLLSFGNEILSVPFSLYSRFKIEKKYGFNTMTLRLWVSDFLKSLLISAIIMTLLIFAALFIIKFNPTYWWLWVWSFLLAYSIFVMYISPYVIEPLFNKFTPVDDESLKEKIIRLADKVGIHTSRILKMDASKRSRHTNAYFTGIGKTKRIVLFDTLLNNMSHNEIIAVLAHEIGHWKKRHLVKTMILFEVFSLVAIYLSFRLIQGDLLLRLFNISSDTLFVKVLIISFLGGIITLPFTWLMNSFSRRHEREADRISYELTENRKDMVSALVKLSKENLSNLYPHPLFVALYYSHPPILERIRYIRALSEV